MTSLCLANFLLIHLTKPYSVNMVDHSKPGGIYHREDEKVRISICHERVDANLTLASTGICNELVQCKIYNKSAIFSSIFSLVHSTWKIFLYGNNWDPHTRVCWNSFGLPASEKTMCRFFGLNIRTNSLCRRSLQR